MSTSNARFARYRQALAAISARTGTPLPSLILSFGILHELTAVVPVVAIFYGAKTLGIGERVVASIIEETHANATGADGAAHVRSNEQLSWAKQKMKTWVEEGDRWAIRIGRRYGIFGYEKREPGTVDNVEEMAKANIAGDVANAVFAYGATKALLPVRIAASLYLSPMFSRGVIEPTRRIIVQTFRRRTP
ncbi:hypothetical protein BDN70DRAFT_927052 [Pholiota conissans]|uniref:Uncharacterized protein n=1 Tax=Pholiota conissans TaxID=109636 RepID=A0A9P5ZGK3_9AGAR|nr:hypothetical protein BDN70DRAFT_927052 [Pholiota conissans]